MPEPSEPVVTVVVAAGSGTRLGGETPKALREIAGRPLVLRSIERLAAGGCTHAVVVVPADAASEFQAGLRDAPIPCTFVSGGAVRQDSVRFGLDAVAADPALAGCRVVLIHDAARALVPAEVVGRVIGAVRAGAVAVIPVVPVIDTIRQVTGSGSRVVDRSDLRAVQTPQGFDLRTISDAHALLVREGLEVTDDAAACEHAGHSVVLVEGSRESLKVTEPLDLVFAEAIARAGEREVCRG